MSLPVSRWQTSIFCRRNAFWKRYTIRTFALDAPKARQQTERFTQWKRDGPPYNHRPRFLKPDEAFFGVKHEEPPTIKPGEGISYFENNVKSWTSNTKEREVIEAFGIPSDDLTMLMKAFEEAVVSKSLSDPCNAKRYDLHRFEEPAHHLINISVLYSTIFFSWSNNPLSRPLLRSLGVKSSTLETISKLVRATDRTYFDESFPVARRLRRRIIMHVGPTNSGKTYHALRALAAARTGVYAGPLRLLAHEIWERLNLGQIAPAGSEDPSFSGTDEYKMLDTIAHADAIKKYGNPKYTRMCNMVTGEEQKTVSPDAPLLSCTVEMLNYIQVNDVGVIDEIQMISDPERGGGWTSAVLGLPARELHLCGEETAVPIVQELLKNTGDTIEVKRYERLTPLAVESESLGEDWSKVRKGDCVVVFSRSGIFKIKDEIEQATGLRCAVIYGRLPPEIRSEQAALFNDPNSGYDVLVGSDAIGMGLNLKIRRVIFHALSKLRSGGGTEPLSISAVKQIAGRAGRFGMQSGSEAPGGFATTFQPGDMNYLRTALATPFSPLPFARLAIMEEVYERIVGALPKGSTTRTVMLAHHYISPLSPKTRYHESALSEGDVCDFVDRHGGNLSHTEKVRHLNAPVAWRDPLIVDVAKRFMLQGAEKGVVDIHEVFEGTMYISVLRRVEVAKERGHSIRKPNLLLRDLETLHKAMVLYIWMSYRAPVMYPQGEEVQKMKEKVEEYLQFTLQAMTAQQRAEEQAEERRMGQQWGQRSFSSSKPHIPSMNRSQMRAEAQSHTKSTRTGTL